MGYTPYILCIKICEVCIKVYGRLPGSIRVPFLINKLIGIKLVHRLTHVLANT